MDRKGMKRKSKWTDKEEEEEAEEEEEEEEYSCLR